MLAVAYAKSGPCKVRGYTYEINRGRGPVATP